MMLNGTVFLVRLIFLPFQLLSFETGLNSRPAPPLLIVADGGCCYRQLLLTDGLNQLLDLPCVVLLFKYVGRQVHDVECTADDVVSRGDDLVPRVGDQTQTLHVLRFVESFLPTS